MRHLTVAFTVLLFFSSVRAGVAATIDVPGAPAVQAAVKASGQRDQFARTGAAASILASIVRAQAGDRARNNAFTPAEAARIAELDGLYKAAERNDEAILPVGCQGRDCEERYDFNRCYGKYLFSAAFYRAVFDRFFDANVQRALTPALSNAGSVWRDALAMPANSHPLDQFAPPSKACTEVVTSSPVQTAGAPNPLTAGPAAPMASAQLAPTPTAAFAPHEDALRRARAASVDTTVFGLALGEPLRLPQCPAQPLIGVFGAGVSTTCIRSDKMTAGVESMIGSLESLGTRGTTAIPYDATILMPAAKCPSWVTLCQYRVHLVDGRVVAVFMDTHGIAVQKDVAAALTQKYKGASKSGWKEWTNNAGKKLLGLEMSWNLPGLTVNFEGYVGGSRDATGSLLIETDAITRARAQQEKAQQAEKEKL